MLYYKADIKDMRVERITLIIALICTSKLIFTLVVTVNGVHVFLNNSDTLKI